MPKRTSLEIKGLDELRARLDAAPAFIERVIPEELERSAKGVHEKLFTYTQDYPEKPSGSRYVRTFDLMHSGQYRAHKRDARIWSGLDYAGAVLGYDSQIDIHAGRWWTNKEIADEMTEWVGQNFAKAMGRLARYIATGF